MSHYGYVSEKLLPEWISLPRRRRSRRAPVDRTPEGLDVDQVRRHVERGRGASERVES